MATQHLMRHRGPRAAARRPPGHGAAHRPRGRLDRRARGRRRAAGGPAPRPGGLRGALDARDPGPRHDAPRDRPRPARPRRVGRAEDVELDADRVARLARRADRAHVPVAADAGRLRARRRHRRALRGRARRPARRPRARRLARAGALRARLPRSAPRSSGSSRSRARRRTTACGASARSTSTACSGGWASSGEPFEAYNLDRARTPSAMAALGSLMASSGCRRSRRPSSRGSTSPTTLIWGRHDHATPLRVAEAVERPPRLAAARDRGLRRRSRDRAAGGVPARAAALGTLALRGRVHGRDRRARPPPLRRAAPGLQRDGRPPPGADRALRRRARRGGGDRPRPRQRPARVRLRRRPQRHRQRGLRRRRHHRPAADEGDRGRPRGAHLPRRGGAHVGRARRRDPGARPRGDRRAGVHDGPRRARARRRLGLDRAQLRLHGRQPDLGRDRDGRRAHPHRLRARAPGPLLGLARRRRELRRGHQVRAAAAPDRPDRPGRAPDLPGPDGGGGAAELRRR